MTDWWRNELYSQFGEDGVLFAYFRNKAYAKRRRMETLESDAGFYVDIGAHHPFMISNTWFFYQRGWRGINVDPARGIMEEFNIHRPRDINLQIAIADEDGDATFFVSERSVLNSLIPWDEATDRYTVPTMRMETLLDRHLPPGQTIDILSVDVEGLDLTVLRSNHWERYRPELIVVEQHETSIQQIVASEMFEEMGRWGYHLHGWTPPSVIFRRVT